ncbi:MAG: T9SS type A sorting domain-containing protein, partial [Duncaniella sp.]|nr:T9SS type A sorting domain-containing protein [Duncaniella sp.]
FMAAPQWKEFSIAQSGAPGLTGELGGMPSQVVSAAWNGVILTITSDSEPIETVTLYDISGRLLHSCDNIASSTFTIDTGGFTTDFYIIHVTTPPAAVSFKTARR